MEKRDLELIRKYGESDKVLANLYQEHVFFEKELEELEKKTQLSDEDEFQIKALKKKKLMGRDRIENILRKYRSNENHS